MSRESGLLAVIPARGGSKGLPGKNLRLFAGLPLIAHSILFAKSCPEIGRVIVSTDSSEIAKVAQEYGAEIPFMRPAELARDETPLWAVVRHALLALEGKEGPRYDALLLLDPTSPAREMKDVKVLAERLRGAQEADGIISVTRPSFNPIWHCVVEREGWMEDLFPEGSFFDRRQDLPKVYRIDGSFYLWRTQFVRSREESWRRGGRYLLHEIPEIRAWSFDTKEQFEQAEHLVKNGKVRFLWLEDHKAPCAR